MGFVRIIELYPNDYILVKIIEIDHEKGRETGIAIYTASTWQELSDYAKEEGIINDTIILQGENLIPVMGNLL